MISRLWLLLLLLVPVAASPQAPPRWNFAVDRFDVDDGLPGNAVTDLEISDDGRLWLLASGRVVSFDGVDFEEHDLVDPATGGLPYVLSLGAGVADTLWVTIDNRVLVLADGGLELVAEHNGYPRDIWQEDDGSLWAIDGTGILRLNDNGFERAVTLPERWQFYRLERDELLPPAAPGDRIRYVDPRAGMARTILGRWLADPRGFPALWPGARERGELLVIEDRGDSLSVASAGRTVRIADEPRRRPLRFDQRGLLWTRSPTHLEAFAEDGSPVARIPLGRPYPFDSFREDPRGNLWTNTREDGLVRIRALPVDVLAGPEGLPAGQVHNVSTGDDGSVLVIEEGGAVFQTDGLRVDTVWAGRESPILSALVDRRGTLWVVADEGERTVLAGRSTEGDLLRVPIPSRWVSRIREDPDIDGLLWLAGHHLFRVRAYGEDGPAVEPPLLSFDPGARDLLFAGDGGLWVAHQRGVTRWSEDGVQTFPADAGHPTGHSRTLHEDEDGSLWIGRYFGGIVRFRDGRFDEIRADDGLWEDVVNSILPDDEGNFWMSGNRGVHRVPRQALDDFIEGRISRVPGRGYGSDQGFLNPESSGWPGVRTADGRLWFPTFEGIAVIDPARVLPRDRHAPGIRLREIRTEREVFPTDSVVQLPLGDRRIEFGFAAVDLSEGGTHRYEVSLEGVDADWVDVGRQRSTTYTNVPPGRHSFSVRARTEAGVPSPAPASVQVVVPPFFHETRTFGFLVALMFGSLLWGGYRLRSRRMRANAIELQRLVASRTADLARSRAEAEEALVTVGRQADELRLLGEAKSRFFANVSHELRTPLTLVNGPLAEVLDDRFGATPEPVREQLSLIQQSGRRLGELVEQLLDVARLDAGELELHRAKVDLRPLFVRFGRSFTSLAAGRGIQVKAFVQEGPLQAVVDADQVEKVVANLLSNAVKFTPAGGAVAYTVFKQEGDGGSELVIRVEDDGPGIDPAHHEGVFERFQRRADESAGGGTGLGLALVREITELHGGRVELRSAPGRGSRFTVILPTGVEAEVGPDGDAEVAAMAVPRVLAPVEGNRQASDLAVGEEDGPSGGEEAEQPTVLIVEDHEGLRDYIRRQLESRYRIVEAWEGLQGLELARRIVPDLILCDIMMPGIDGDELCRIVRSDPELSYLPVIMLTAKAARESRLSALANGADDYLVKPFDPDELRLRVDNLLAGRKRHAEHLRADQGPWEGWEPPEPRSDSAFAKQLFALLRERANDEEFGTTAMAKALAMSRTTLYRKVADSLDSSPAELLWTFRLEQAAQWLRDTDARVSDVAYGCGFRTVPHFTRKFKERYGTTPAAWRNESGHRHGIDSGGGASPGSGTAPSP